MEKKRFLSDLLCPIIVAALAVLLLLLGSFVDLSFAEALYSGDGTIPKLVSFISPLLGVFVISASAILLFLHYRRSPSKTARNASWAALVIVIFGGIFYGLAVLSSSFSTTISLILGIFVAAALAVLAYFILRNLDTRDFGRIGYMWLFSSVLVFGFAFLLNKAIVRPNYAMLLLSDEAGTDYMSFYRPWYLLSVDASAYPATLDSSYYASFPSLSTALASLGLVLPVGCSLIKPLKNEQKITFWVAFFFVAIDGITTFLKGKSFLSDFSFALLIGVAPAFFALAFAHEDNKTMMRLANNKAKHIKKVRKSIRTPLVYGVGARRGYEEQIPPLTRKKIRFKNNRTKAKKEDEGIYIKIDKYRL